MHKKIWLNKVWLVVTLCLVTAFPFSAASARDSRGDHKGHGPEVIVVKSDKGHPRDRGFYHGGWFSFALSFFTPPQRTVVKAAPCHYPNVVVQQPAVFEPKAYYTNTITINLPNTYGGYTPVTLVRCNDGYIGPQGEYYPGSPTVYQLRALYGR